MSFIAYTQIPLFISDGLCNYYKKSFSVNPRLCEVIPSSVDTSIFKPTPSKIRKEMGYDQKDIIIGYIGTLSASRHLDEFIDLMLPVLKKRANLNLVFIGDGDSKKQLQNYIKEKGIMDSVVFLNQIPHSLVPEYISSFNFGLCYLPNDPIYKYSFPLKILEYLACGIPVMVNDMDAHREIMKRLDNIYIYTSSFDFEKNNRFINNTKKRVKIFSWEKNASKYNLIYGKL